MARKVIGIFDSGVGGLAMVQAVRTALPRYTIHHIDDHEHVPYGNKSSKELEHLVTPKLERLVDQGCEVIVVACNTVTTTIIEELRRIIPVPLIGMEPMVKPAAELTSSRVIAVCATPATLASDRYAWLKAEYANDIQVLEPDCSDWAQMIETNQVNRTIIQQRIDQVCRQGADVIVLGCTHYHWIEQLITDLTAGRATVLQPEGSVIAQLKRVIEQLP